MFYSFKNNIYCTFLLCSLIFTGYAAMSQVSLFRLIPSQSIVLPGDALAYAIMCKPGFVDPKAAPVYHLVLQDLNKNEIKRWMIRPEGLVFTSVLDLPLTLQYGTYILSIALYDDAFTRVLAEEDHTIHVLGQGMNTINLFEKQEGNAPMAAVAASPSFTRDMFCEGSPSAGLYSFCDSMTAAYASYTIHTAALDWNNTKSLNIQRQLAYRILPAEVGDLQLFYDLQSLGVTQVKYADPQAGIVKMPDFKGIKPVQWVHVLTYHTEPKMTQHYPALEWTKDEIKTIPLEETTIKHWYDKLQQRALLQNIFDRDTLFQKAKRPRPVILTADNDYDLSKFQPFESLTLFMKEIMLPIKVIEKAKGKDLRILMNTTKEWFAQSPLLLVDGYIQTNVALVYDIPVQDVLSVHLYRNAETLLRHFGPMGRNGVIEVKTKSKGYATSSIQLNGFELQGSFITNNNSGQSNEFNAGGMQYFGFYSSTDRLCFQLNDEPGHFIWSRYFWQQDVLQVERRSVDIQVKP